MRKTAFALILIFILSLALPGLAAKPAVREATWARGRCCAMQRWWSRRRTNWSMWILQSSWNACADGWPKV